MNACDECIYTYPDCPTGEIDKKFDEVHGDNFNVVSCVNYVNNDGSYHDGHWHCHRCGKIVEVAGLCYECEMDLYGMRHFTPEEQEIMRKAYERDSVVLNPIDESWESVSK